MGKKNRNDFDLPTLWFSIPICQLFDPHYPIPAFLKVMEQVKSDVPRLIPSSTAKSCLQYNENLNYIRLHRTVVSYRKSKLW